MAKFYTSEELAESLCIRSGDPLMHNKALYLDCCEDVWIDMNEDVLKIANRVKIPVRQVFNVDKKTNSVNIPNKALKVSSISAVDKWGCYSPLYRNDSIEDDVIDLGAAHDCGCENNCSSKLCNTIKGYEAVKTTKSDFLPNGDAISFDCIDKKMLDDNGFLYEQLQYPLRIYVSGVWTDTVKHTENKKLCAVEVDDNGCVCDTEQNLNIICDACNISDTSIVYGGDSINPPACAPDATTWMYQCASKMEWFNVQCGDYAYRCGNGFGNIYNISQLGNRIIFPSNFGYGKVMIRFYEDIDLKDIRFPYLAKEAAMTGIQYFAATNHDKKQNLATAYGQKYSRQKWGLLLALNKYTLAELNNIFIQKVFVPSYLENRYYNDGYRNY